MNRSNTLDPRAGGPKGPGILDPEYLRLSIMCIYIYTHIFVNTAIYIDECKHTYSMQDGSGYDQHFVVMDYVSPPRKGYQQT